MTVVSVTQAAHRLGIDAKTLRRWLEQAHLPLQSHPSDGRKKGLSAEDLQVLAHLHQRRLAPLPKEPPAPVPSDLPELSAALLVLPEAMCALQTKIAALEQQVAALTRLLLQHCQEPAIPAASTPQAGSARRPSKHTSPAPHSRPDVKSPRKSVPVIPRVEYGTEGHYVVICPKHGVLPFEPDTEEWFAWVAKQDSFRFVGKAGHFTAHHEWRVPKGAWRAHRHIRNPVSIQRLAPNHELTIAVLEQAAAALQAHLSE